MRAMNKSLVSMLKKISLVLVVFFVLLLIYINLPFVFRDKHTCIIIYPGEKFSAIEKDIASKSTHLSPMIIKLYSKFIHLDKRIEVGEYCFNQYASIVDIMTKIARAHRELHAFTLVDGWTYSDMIKHLNQSPMLSGLNQIESQDHVKFELENRLKPTAYFAPSSQAVTVGSSISLSSMSPSAKQQYDETKVNSSNDAMINLEGQFYPATYYYAYPDTALHILQQAHSLMLSKIKSYNNPYEILIIASIIEKEASDPLEQMIISGIIYQRMKLHMKLQMDATVIYGLANDYSGRLSKSDLKKDTPYNTYLHFGLPPTPICMPGETALYAAAHPRESEYLYYVSKKNGKHQFSKTLTEQNEAIVKYLLKEKKNES